MALNCGACGRRLRNNDGHTIVKLTKDGRKKPEKIPFCPGECTARAEAEIKKQQDRQRAMKFKVPL